MNSPEVLTFQQIVHRRARMIYSELKHEWRLSTPYLPNWLGRKQGVEIRVCASCGGFAIPCPKHTGTVVDDHGMTKDGHTGGVAYMTARVRF